MASPAIELRSVSVDFDNERILKNINLKIERGEIFVLLGPSGHGKSVLLKVLAGLIVPTEGQVLYDGNDFHKLSSQAQDEWRCKTGMLFQNNALFDSLTAEENVAFPLGEAQVFQHDWGRDKINIKSREFLDAVGILHAAQLYPDEMSGGMQKRLGIARAIALMPDTILYDDPTAGLDPITSKKIIDLIIGFNKSRKTTTIAVTNEVNRAYQMANRIGMMLFGELIVTGSIEETKKSQDARVKQFINGQLAGPLTEPQ